MMCSIIYSKLNKDRDTNKNLHQESDNSTDKKQYEPILNPSTTTGYIVINTVVAVVSTIILAALAWFLGPLKWPFQSRRIQKLLADGRHFRFVYNPAADKSKIVTFFPNGQVGEGANSNENKWRIRRGKLEIIAFNGEIYSRFRYDSETGKLVHTNDPDTRSILGQYFEPQFKPWTLG